MTNPNGNDPKAPYLVCGHSEKISPKNRNYLTVTEATKVANVSPNTIRAWCITYKLGIQVGNRWRINPARLDLIVRGELQPADVSEAV